jgi:hypothetical protein
MTTWPTCSTLKNEWSGPHAHISLSRKALGEEKKAMLPSDHYVRFYNEIFKYLESQGHEHLEKYWLEISRLQESHLLENFRENGLQGMYDYWDRIRIEENCDLTLELSDDCLASRMNMCPSLSKVLDNDAAPSPLYCDHCPGWVGPIMKKLGYYYLKEIGDPAVPRCAAWIYSNKGKAEEKIRELQNNKIEFKSYIE